MEAKLVEGQRNLFARDWAEWGPNGLDRISQPAARAVVAWVKTVLVAKMSRRMLERLVVEVVKRQTSDETEARETIHHNLAGCRKELGFLSVDMVPMVTTETLREILAAKRSPVAQAMAYCGYWPEITLLAIEEGVINAKSLQQHGSRGVARGVVKDVASK